MRACSPPGLHLGVQPRIAVQRHQPWPRPRHALPQRLPLAAVLQEARSQDVAQVRAQDHALQPTAWFRAQGSGLRAQDSRVEGSKSRRVRAAPDLTRECQMLRVWGCAMRVLADGMATMSSGEGIPGENSESERSGRELWPAPPPTETIGKPLCSQPRR
eukprot:896367-Rhodomonas_salina.1